MNRVALFLCLCVLLSVSLASYEFGFRGEQPEDYEREYETKDPEEFYE